MSSNTRMSTKSPVPHILRAPVAIKIFDLNNSTVNSALRQAQQIVWSFHGQEIERRGAKYKVDCEQLDVTPGNPTADKSRKQFSATVRFKDHLYESVDKMPDEKVLEALMFAIEAQGYYARPSASANNDRSTMVKYEVYRLNEVETASEPDKDLVDEHLAQLLAELDLKPIGIVVHDVEDDRNATGIVGFAHPVHAQILEAQGRGPQFYDTRNAAPDTPEAQLPLYGIDFYHHPQHIPVTSFSSVALNIQSSPITTLEELTADVDRIISIVESIHPGETVKRSDVFMTRDRAWCHFDLSAPKYALDAVKIPAFNNDFYESTYFINTDLNNFEATTRNTRRLSKMAEWNRLHPRVNTSTDRPPSKRRRGVSSLREKFDALRSKGKGKGSAFKRQTHPSGGSLPKAPAPTINTSSAPGPSAPSPAETIRRFDPSQIDIDMEGNGSAAGGSSTNHLPKRKERDEEDNSSLESVRDRMQLLNGE